ncbi:MAG: hypothetical protein R6W70_06425 [bacterium]
MRSTIVVFNLFFILIFSCSNDGKDIYEETENNGIPGSDTDLIETDDSSDIAEQSENDYNSVTDHDFVENEDKKQDYDYHDDEHINDSEISDIDIFIPDAENPDEDSHEIPDEDSRVVEVEILKPSPGEIFEAGQDVTFRGQVSDSSYNSDEITVKWILEKDSVETVLQEKKASAAGISEFQHSFPKEVAGSYFLSMTAFSPDMHEFSTEKRVLGICKYPFGEVQTFDSESMEDGWVYVGDAYWDSDESNGWLELTGNEKNKKGVIYNKENVVHPGDITMKIDIRTGGGPGEGADGFAMTVFDTDNSVTLEDYVNRVRSGGCLAYGVAGPYCGGEDPMEVFSFHIEFDTWYNSETGLDDPTEENHIAITLNGHPGEHLLSEETMLEDLQWHNLEISTKGSKVTVKKNGVEIIEGTIPDFSFRGGYIMFSGSTGASTNFHSIDNLEVIQECTVP